MKPVFPDVQNATERVQNTLRPTETTKHLTKLERGTAGMRLLGYRYCERLPRGHKVVYFSC